MACPVLGTDQTVRIGAGEPFWPSHSILRLVNAQRQPEASSHPPIAAHANRLIAYLLANGHMQIIAFEILVVAIICYGKSQEWVTEVTWFVAQ